MKLRKFQQGGPAPAAPEQAPAEAQAAQAAPEEQLAQMAQQIVQQLGPEAAAMLAEMIMQMLQGGGGEQPQGQPAFQRQGGKLVMIGRR